MAGIYEHLNRGPISAASAYENECHPEEQEQMNADTDEHCCDRLRDMTDLIDVQISFEQSVAFRWITGLVDGWKVHFLTATVAALGY